MDRRILAIGMGLFILVTALATSASDFLIVTSTGNVGIGTSTPAYLLDVAGSGTGTLDVARLQNTVTAANNSAADLLFSANRTTGGLTNVAGLAGMITDITNTAYKGALVFLTADNAAPAERMRIDNNGNVGIGTTSPQNKLSVTGRAYVSDRVGIGTTNLEPATLNIAAGSGTEIMTDTATGNNNLDIATPASVGGRIHLSPRENTNTLILHDGAVGLGTATNPGNILYVVQGSSTDPIADAWTTYSSIRWKENLQPLTGALNKVQQLRGVQFSWKQNKKRDIGLIAEEVGKVIPEIVVYEDNGKDAKSIDYGRLTTILVEAIKDQQAEIRSLQSEIVALKRSRNL
jgi:hypothetical protein